MPVSFSFLADHCALWLNDTSYSKVSEEGNRKCPARTRGYNF